MTCGAAAAETAELLVGGSTGTSANDGNLGPMCTSLISSAAGIVWSWIDCVNYNNTWAGGSDCAEDSSEVAFEYATDETPAVDV